MCIVHAWTYLEREIVQFILKCFKNFGPNWYHISSGCWITLVTDITSKGDLEEDNNKSIHSSYYVHTLPELLNKLVAMIECWTGHH